MIDKLPLVFRETPPDLGDAAFLSLLRSAPAVEAWVKWSALLLGAMALLMWALVLLPELRLRGVGLPAGGRVTTAGHVFFAIVGVLGLAALVFALRLFADERPYRQPPDALRRYDVQPGVVTGFGPWISLGGQYSRYQRVHWRTGTLTGSSPYVSLVLAIWLRPGDVAWIGVDPRGAGRPIFLGVQRAAPGVLKNGTQDFRTLYEALERHLAEGGDARTEKLLKVWGAGRR